MKTSEAQIKASKKWKEKNKDKQKLYNIRSKAKKFIKDYSTLDDLEALELLISQRRKELGNKNNQVK